MKEHLLLLGRHLYEEVMRDQILLRAGALTYVTLLSLIPILALGISIVNVVGKSEGLARMIVSKVAAGSPETVDQIVGIVNNANFSGLGSVGGGVAFVTTILAIGNVEQAFNQIFGIRKARTWVRRFSDYLTVLIIAPLLLTVSLSLTTTLRSDALVTKLLEWLWFERLFDMGLAHLPLFITAVSFAFLYLVLPNTRVRIGSAVAGGVFASVLFQGVQALYMGLNVGGAKYNALFGGFAALPLLFVWIYFSWVVVLLGACVAFIVQNFRGFDQYLEESFDNGPARETTGLEVAMEVARAFRGQGAALSVSQLAEHLQTGLPKVRDVVCSLEDAGFLAPREATNEGDCYQLARPAEQIGALDVWRASNGTLQGVEIGQDEKNAALRDFYEGLRSAERDRVGAVTLADLVGAAEQEPLES